MDYITGNTKANWNKEKRKKNKPRLFSGAGSMIHTPPAAAPAAAGGIQVRRAVQVSDRARAGQGRATRPTLAATSA